MPRLLLLASALLLPMIAGCDGAADELVRVEVSLFNDSLTPTHIFYETEDFAPSNQVAPLGGRVIQIDILANEGTPQIFRAGRNGTVLQTVSCRPSAASSMDTYQVVFGAAGTLRCVGW